MITVKAYTNDDDVLIAWQPAPWPKEWVGFQLERRDEQTQQMTTIVNRIPPKAGEGPVAAAGVPSSQSPIRRCIWTDHNVIGAYAVSYRVTPMKEDGNGGFAPDATSASSWTTPLVTKADAGNGLSACFNRGTLMSQIVSRFVQGNVTEDSIRQFLQNLETPAFPARRYLAGDALPAITGFLHDADRRGNSVHLAIYEFNDHELVDALKVFGERGHVLLGNGGATQPWVAQELTAAGLEVHHRDLSHSGKSSPSVHNKFLVESDATGKATRVLTGSTNWTTTGLCTQLNNVLIVERPVIAGRFLDQWNKLVAAGDDMTPDLKASNSQPTNDQELSLFFAATNNEAEFKPVLDLIAGARQGALFLMFMPGQSPLLEALLDRAQQNDIYVRGVVSSINAPKADGQMGSVAGEVVKSGADAQSFHKDVLVPVGISDKDKPSFQETEFTVGEIKAAHLMAIVHSKAIVIDPFSKDCAVITGSHNFSVSASGKNDENLVIIRGNQALAQAYALHINGVYDHYSWRAFLASGGDADQVFKPLDGWKSGGARAQELAFWMGGPVPPQNGSGKASPKSAPAKPPARGSKSPAPGGNGRKKPKPVSAPAAVRNAAAAKAKTTKAKATQTRAKTPTKRQPAKTKTKPPTKRQAPKAKSPVKRKSVPKASPGRAKKK